MRENREGWMSQLCDLGIVTTPFLCSVKFMSVKGWQLFTVQIFDMNTSSSEIYSKINKKKAQ